MNGNANGVLFPHFLMSGVSACPIIETMLLAQIAEIRVYSVYIIHSADIGEKTTTGGGS